jgi:hypothetical protein
MPFQALRAFQAFLGDMYNWRKKTTIAETANLAPLGLQAGKSDPKSKESFFFCPLSTEFPGPQGSGAPNL